MSYQSDRFEHQYQRYFFQFIKHYYSLDDQQKRHLSHITNLVHSDVANDVMAYSDIDLMLKDLSPFLQEKLLCSMNEWDPYESSRLSLFVLNSLKGKLTSYGFLDHNQQKKILVIGHGLGGVCLSLAIEHRDYLQSSLLIEGWDCSSTATDLACWRQTQVIKKKNVQLPLVFYKKNITDHIPYDVQIFDFILDNHCLHSLIQPNHRSQYFQQILKQLRTGGFYFLESLTYDKEWSLSEHYFLDSDYILWRCDDQVTIPMRYCPPIEVLEKEILSHHLQIILLIKLSQDRIFFDDQTHGPIVQIIAKKKQG